MSSPDARADAIAVALASSTSKMIERSSALITRRSAAIAMASGRSPVRTASRSTLLPLRSSASGAANHAVGTASAQVDAERRSAKDIVAATSSAEREGEATSVERIDATSNVDPPAARRRRRRGMTNRLDVKVSAGSILEL